MRAGGGRKGIGSTRRTWIEVVKAKPEVLVVGTGFYGCMKVPKETIEFVRSLGIEVYAEPTKDACEKYNELKHAKRVVAALHVTC